jgi:hypothetical protein
MKPRTVAAAVGAGAAVFLVVAALVTEALSVAVEFSALLGLPAGALAGLLALGLLVGRYAALGPATRALADGLAGFGYAVFALEAAQYVNLPGARALLDLPLTVAVAAVVAVGLGVASWATAERRDPRR